MLRINRTFVREWAGVYNHRSRQRDRSDERALKAWLRGQPTIKHLDKGHFVRLASWKTPRARPRYERNAPAVVREVTRLACQASNERLKVQVLMLLDGVNVTVAATILHFFYPRLYPVFDIRDRTTLKKAGWWKRRRADASIEAWEDYVAVMRRLSRRFRVSLRDLDKALYAYDRWRKRRR